MMGLPDGLKSFRIGLVVLIQYRLWRTPSHPATHAASHVAVAIYITLNAKASSLKISLLTLFMRPLTDSHLWNPPKKNKYRKGNKTENIYLGLHYYLSTLLLETCYITTHDFCCFFDVSFCVNMRINCSFVYLSPLVHSQLVTCMALYIRLWLFAKLAVIRNSLTWVEMRWLIWPIYYLRTAKFTELCMWWI